MGRLALTSETLTTPETGTLEYDGGELYFTPLGTQRGLIPNMQYYRLNSNLVGANSNAVQNAFGVGVTLSASTVYAFEVEYVLARTAGVTSHTLAYGFGGTATANNILWNLRRQGTTAVTFPWASTAAVGIVPVTYNTLSLQVASTAIANANYVDIVSIKGTISVNTGGTFIPQYQLSAAPGGAYSTIAGSWVMIYPVGASGSNTSIGTWA